MVYNFLDSKLLPKISSNTQPMDNYEVTNLISDNYITRARGFLAYSTIKPPVEINIELICSVNVHYIVLWATVGTQRTTGVEICAKNSNTNFVPIAYARFKNDGVAFCNGRIYSANNPPRNLDKSFHLSFFKPNSFRSFATANSIKVCIFQTEKSVPCLGRIEIWGKPSKTCSSTTIDTINRLMFKTNDVPHESNTDSSLSASNKPNNFEIPEEFKDMLTFEIMSLPITLPSGNSIDQTTLEKFVATEASYGRAPSDPFTGQKFTDSRKPIFNAALKSRIDIFLLQHSQKSETFALKRTLGRATSHVANENKMREKDKDEDRHLKRIKLDTVNQVHEERKCSDPDELLNEAIKKTINSENFIRFTSDESIVTNDVIKCVTCKNGENLYSLPCDHLYCRVCLVHMCKKLKCSECNEVFCKTQVKKFHSC